MHLGAFTLFLCYRQCTIYITVQQFRLDSHSNKTIVAKKSLPKNLIKKKKEEEEEP